MLIVAFQSDSVNFDSHGTRISALESTGRTVIGIFRHYSQSFLCSFTDLEAGHISQRMALFELSAGSG